MTSLMYTPERQGSDAGFSFVSAFLSNSPSSVGSYPGATLAGTQAESTVKDFCFMPMTNMIGQRFNSLFVTAHYRDNGRTKVDVVCDCGTVKSGVDAFTVRKGLSKSCGCAKIGHPPTHGCSRKGEHTPEYSSWASMRARVLNPRHSHYHNYGGRGIKICERWSDFANFLADMGSRPKGYSLERKNNNGDYDPINCVWATRTTQARNRRPRRWFRRPQ